MDLFEQQTLFVEVILPLPLPRLFTYRVPMELSPMTIVGARVVVPFGQRKVLTGIIANISNKPPQEFQAKYLIDILDNGPLLNDKQLQFYNWIADYYLCHLGEVINIAIPSGFKVNSESYVQLNPERIEDDLEAEEQLVIACLQSKDLWKYQELEKSINKKGFSKIIHQLISKGQILLIQKVDEKYSPKTEKRIRLNPELISEEAINELFELSVGKAKQQAVLLAYLQLLEGEIDESKNLLGVLKNELVEKDCSPSSIRTLVKHQILEEFDKKVDRILQQADSPHTLKEIQLTTGQQEAVQKTKLFWESGKPVLLHGITGSGKTEIYFSLIQQTLEEGKQALLLLPEIALTTQIVKRVEQHFGKHFGIYHSRYSDNERVEIWKKVQNKEIQLVVGVRSSIFLPFDDLGLIIVDEEHDASYKQVEPAPRYNARDSVHILAKMHGSKLLLGSATPAYESFYLATEDNKWAYVSLKERYSEGKLPQIKVLSNQYQYVEENFKEVLNNKLSLLQDSDQQALIFKNRRGYSPYVQCKTCEHILMCPNCNVSLTYHQFSNECRCHYCSYSIRIPERCPECGDNSLNPIGQGTEKIEDDLHQAFPEINIERMDYDTTRRKNAYHRIIEDFSSGKTQVLVGTQMITKGLDFKNITLVGVLDADFMLNFPDFRAKEKSYQILTQVAGRAGRKGQDSLVLIHSNQPESPFFNYVKEGKYEELYQLEIEEREAFVYPPFSRIVRIIIKNEERDKALYTAQVLNNHISQQIQTNFILGPQEPVINKIRNQFIYELQIKLPKDKALTQRKEYIWKCKGLVEQQKDHKKSTIVIDVDPI